MSVKWRLKALANVLLDAWPALLAMGGFGLAWASAWELGSAIHAKVSDQILYAGMIIELLGIGLVIWDLGATLKKFGRPSLLGQILGWFRRLAAIAMPSRTALGTATSRSVSTAWAVGQGVIVPRDDASVDERISALEKNLENFRDEMDVRMARMANDLAAATQNIAQASRELKEATGAIDRKLEDLAVGGTHLEVIGLIWICVGIFLTNIPEPIAGWLGYE